MRGPGPVGRARAAVIRRAEPRDAGLLPAVERSAAAVFRAIPDLAWLAESDGLPVAVHLAAVEAETAWVAVDANDAPFGFLTAVRADRDLHILELSVCRERQGVGHGQSLVARAVATARVQRLSAVTLTTFHGVAWNEPFYARLGFATIDAAALTDRLKAILAAEAERGLPADRRCAMRLPLKPDGAR